MGLAVYYRKFVKGFANLAQLMTQLTGKDVKFIWSEKNEKCFSALKDILASEPVLVLPEADQPYVVYTDASLTGLGYYDVDIAYHLGKAKLVADALSRRGADVSTKGKVDGQEGMVCTLHLNSLTGREEPLGLEAVNKADLLTRIRIAQGHVASMCLGLG
ncbi:hypothetical protein N665_1192s0002 [Sinapis alba]|nr:hypothetical protein N665_1192s0002 [Sinapis alba]